MLNGIVLFFAHYLINFRFKVDLGIFKYSVGVEQTAWELLLLILFIYMPCEIVKRYSSQSTNAHKKSNFIDLLKIEEQLADDICDNFNKLLHFMGCK